MKFDGNILFIGIDTCRADRLSCYGYRKKTSPNIDELAKEGVLFSKCFSQSNCTHPGWTTLFTGLYPLSHNIISHEGEAVLNPEIKMLAEYLKGTGYTTISISTLGKWFSRGCDNSGVSTQKYPQFQGGKKVSAELILAHTLDALENAKDNKFFIFAHFWDPHTPYIPPKRNNKFYEGKDPKDLQNNSLRLFKKGVWGEIFWGKWEENWPELYKDITDAEYVASLYDGEINHTDEAIGKIVNKLQDLKIREKTLIIVASDHGETLTENNNVYYGQPLYFGHLHLYEPNIHIPLLFNLPGVLPKGRVIDSFVEQVDVTPTILSLLKIKPHYELDGVSLLPLIEGRRNKVKNYIYTLENTYQRHRAIRDENWKYIVSLEPERKGIPLKEMYNLREDPEEMMNIVDIKPSRGERLNVALNNWVRKILKKWGKEIDPQKIQKLTFAHSILPYIKVRFSR